MGYQYPDATYVILCLQKQKDQFVIWTHFLNT